MLFGYWYLQITAIDLFHNRIEIMRSVNKCCSRNLKDYSQTLNTTQMCNMILAIISCSAKINITKEQKRVNVIYVLLLFSVNTKFFDISTFANRKERIDWCYCFVSQQKIFLTTFSHIVQYFCFLRKLLGCVELLILVIDL